jgi:hypothetical protein
MNRKLLLRAPFIFAFCFLAFSFCLSVTLADYHPIEVKAGGTVRGLVKYPSETRARAMFATYGDPLCPTGIPQENLIVKQENRGIKNALVVLEVNQGKPLKPVKAQLETKDCRFMPRIQWATKGTSLLVVNGDHTTHKVRALREGVSVFSLDLQANGPPVRRPLVQTGLYKINDERHLWMRSWLYVTDQPYVTTTDEEGRFQLTDIPPGTYTLRVWHEGWRERGTETGGQLSFIPMSDERRVTIKSASDTDVLLDTLSPAFD